MSRLLTGVVVVALVASIAGAAFGRDASVKLRVAPASVKAGSTVRVTASVSLTGARCGGTIRHAAKSITLRSKNASGHELSWKAKIPATAPAGTWTVRVACAQAGSATAKLTVKARTPETIPAKIDVLKSGMSARASGGTTYAGWGVVLKNVSPDEDAMDVDVTLHFVDAAGGSVRYATEDYEAIPAGATYYLGGDDTFTGNPPVRIEVTAVHVGFRQKNELGRLAPVANIHENDDGTNAHVLGNFENPYQRTISSVASITSVCFDAAGNVIGGGRSYARATVSPGSKLDFDVPVLSLHSTQIASAQVSVEPHFFR